MENFVSYDERRPTWKKDNLDLRNSGSPFFEWENESIYEDTVQRLAFSFLMVMFISVCETILHSMP
jgi:hypothetical protein